jgi:signal transduction histidine kinase
LESGRWYIRRALPYLTEDKQISGVVVNYTDITEYRQAHDAVRATRRDLSASIQLTAKLRGLSAALALAEERERRTLARDLHDDLGQLLAVIGIKAAVVQRQKMPPPLKHAVDECAAAVDLANQKLRTMALQLNPPMLDQLGLVSALQWLADELARSHRLDVLIQDDGLPKPLDPAVSTTLFRAVRDLLTNVARHAKVLHAGLTLVRADAGHLQLTVSDAGAGFDAAKVLPALDSLSLDSGVPTGLLGLRERIGFLGGELRVDSIPGQGTAVVIRMPLLEAAMTKKTRRRSPI